MVRTSSLRSLSAQLISDAEFLIDLALLRIEFLFDQNLYDFGGGGFHFARVDFTDGTIDGDEIALL